MNDLIDSVEQHEIDQVNEVLDTLSRSQMESLAELSSGQFAVMQMNARDWANN